MCVSAHCPLLQATFDIDPMPLMLPCFSRLLSHESDAKHAAIPVPQQLLYKHSLPGLLRAAQQGTAPLRTGEATGPRPQGRAVAEAGKTPGLPGLCSLGCPELAQQGMSPATGYQLLEVGLRVFLTQVTWLCSGPCSFTFPYLESQAWGCSCSRRPCTQAPSKRAGSICSPCPALGQGGTTSP